MTEHEKRPGGLSGVHPPVQRLIAYSRGELEQRAAARVRKHATECTDCGDQLAALLLLREHMIVGIDEAPVDRRPVRSGRAGGGSFRAGLAVGVIAVVGFIAGGLWWLPTYVDAGADTPAGAETLPAWHDQVLFDGLVEFLDVVFDPALKRATVGEIGDYERVAAAVAALGENDLDQAATLLERYTRRYDRFGSALHAIVLYMRGDPAAGEYLEAYYEVQVRAYEEGAPEGRIVPGGTVSPEAEAFYYLATLREEAGDEQGALEVLAWIAPDTQVGTAAARASERMRAGVY